jgi:hypothetical protein
MFAVPSGSIVRDWTFVSYRTIGNTNGFRDAITSFARTVMRGILVFGSAKLLAGNVGALAAARPLAGSYTARGSCSGTLISTRSLAGRRHRTRPTLELSRAPNCWLARAPFTRSFRQQCGKYSSATLPLVPLLPVPRLKQFPLALLSPSELGKG